MVSKHCKQSMLFIYLNSNSSIVFFFLFCLFFIIANDLTTVQNIQTLPKHTFITLKMKHFMTFENKDNTALNYKQIVYKSKYFFLGNACFPVLIILALFFYIDFFSFFGALLQFFKIFLVFFQF